MIPQVLRESLFWISPLLWPGTSEDIFEDLIREWRE